MSGSLFCCADTVMSCRASGLRLPACSLVWFSTTYGSEAARLRSAVLVACSGVTGSPAGLSLASCPSAEPWTGDWPGWRNWSGTRICSAHAFGLASRRHLLRRTSPTRAG